MAYSTIAVRLARTLDVPIAKAARFIDDVGSTKAARLVDDVENAASGVTRTVTSWWKPAAVGTVAVGGGYTVYQFREQDVEKMREVAEKTQSQEDAIRDIIESDLPPEARQKLVEMYLSRQSTASEDKPSFLGDETTKLILAVVVVAIVLNYALNGGGRR